MDPAIIQNPSSPCPPEIVARLVVLPVRFFTLDGDGRGAAGEADGVIIVDRDCAADVADLFALMLREHFPLASAVPVSDPRFAWDDERSMAANNTSGWNYRTIADGSKLSNHALGRAIDINPLINPFIKGEIVQPAGAVYDPSRPGAITADCAITLFLKSRGWTWGGDWTDRKDYQHFEKP